jgi:hypothetical protein
MNQRMDSIHKEEKGNCNFSKAKLEKLIIKKA